MGEQFSYEAVPADSLSRKFVNTRQTKSCFLELDSLVARKRTRNNAMALQLAGPARCGKTSTIQEYLRRCEARVEGRQPLKSLWVELAATTNARNITNLTLHMLGDPLPSKGDAMARRMRVEQSIIRQGYDLIVFDEAHHLVDSKTESVQEDGVEFLNMLLNRTFCPIVLVGYVAKLRRAIQRNPSLSGRMWPCSEFRTYEIGDADDMMEFRMILKELESFMKMAIPSRLSSADTAWRIALVCKGRLGLLEMFLQYAWELARRNGHSCLTREDLRQAAQTVSANNSEYAAYNPFDAATPEEAIARNVRTDSVQGGKPRRARA